MKLILLLFLQFFSASLVSTATVRLNASFWKSEYSAIEQIYPEQRYEPINSCLKKIPNNGIGVSGGGLRSYMLSLGYFRGLLDLNVMDKIRYISSVSGGSWASLPFIYHKSRRFKPGKESDGEFLGNIYNPSDLSFELLNNISDNCARKIPAALDIRLDSLFNLVVKGHKPEDLWYSAIEDVFLQPMGIPKHTHYFYNSQQLIETVNRNSWLANESLVTPCGMVEKGRFPKGLKEMKDCEASGHVRPFLIVNSVILGTVKEAPFNLFNLNALNLESTPLATGVGQPSILHEHQMSINFNSFVESFGFDSSPTLIKSGFFTSSVDVNRFTLANATAASSWAPGSLLTSNTLINKYLNKYVALEAQYNSFNQDFTKSPFRTSVGDFALKNENSAKVILADGGTTDNFGVISLLRRRVSKIIVLINAETPLAPKEEFNPFIQSPTKDSIDSNFMSYFGFVNDIPTPGLEFKQNHLFNKLNFEWVVSEMQQKQTVGKGIVVKSTLKTVENRFHGIEKDRKVELLWIYLDNCTDWFTQLDPRIQTTLKDQGFPQIPTSKLSYSNLIANSLSNLGGWVIKQNSDVILDFLDH